MKKILTAIITFNLILLASISYANNNIALNYNLTSNIQNGYVVDSNYTDELDFSLFEAEESIYCNGQPLTIEDNKFSISIEGLSGKQDFVFTNPSGETTTYTYYISDDNGYLENYKFEELKKSNTKTYIKTIKGVTVIYTSKDAKSIKTLEEIISSLNLEINLSFISPAASTVNVTTSNESICASPDKIRFEIFSIITVVLPLPAPALTNCTLLFDRRISFCTPLNSFILHLLKAC